MFSKLELHRAPAVEKQPHKSNRSSTRRTPSKCGVDNLLGPKGSKDQEMTARSAALIVPLERETEPE